jgi:hypothetical protein
VYLFYFSYKFIVLLLYIYLLLLYICCIALVHLLYCPRVFIIVLLSIYCIALVHLLYCSCTLMILLFTFIVLLLYKKCSHNLGSASKRRKCWGRADGRLQIICSFYAKDAWKFNVLSSTFDSGSVQNKCLSAHLTRLFALSQDNLSQLACRIVWNSTGNNFFRAFMPRPFFIHLFMSLALYSQLWNVITLNQRVKLHSIPSGHTVLNKAANCVTPKLACCLVNRTKSKCPISWVSNPQPSRLHYAPGGWPRLCTL